MESIMLQNLLFYRQRISKSREAIYDYDNGIRYTYGQLYRRAGRLARFLVDTCHLQKGDCVGFYSASHVAFFDAFFSSFQTGIIVSSYNYKLHQSELLKMVQSERPRVLFYGADLGENLNYFRENTEIEHYIALTGPLADTGDWDYERVIAEGQDCSPVDTPLEENDIQMYLHTGGTTGTPKTAMISYRTVFYNCVCDILTNALSMTDCAYVFLPMFHTSAWNIITLPLLMCGGRIVLTSHFNAGTALDIIARERPTIGMAVPSMYKLMAEHENFLSTDFSCFRWLSSGGATAQKNIMEAYWKRGVPLANGYGMTEVGPHNLTMPLVDMSMELIRKKWQSVGVPMYFNHIRIVDDHLNDVPVGTCGELLFRGPLVFSGYLNNEAESDAMIHDGWVRTGDMAWQDPDGYYYIAGRKKQMFISGGENIYTAEIEAVIGAHHSVLDVCVIGVDDACWGEVGKAIMVVEPDLYRQSDLQEFLKEHLSTIKIPKHLVTVDSLPLNAAGKRDMHKIKKLYGERLPR